MTAEHTHPNYMGVFWTLFGITILELGAAALLQNSKLLLIILLVAMAFTKAILVAMYFMHLKFERKTFVFIVCAPLVLALVLVIGLMPDVGLMTH